ncbi:MAG: hypothetical protein JNL70_19070 [Saprospiraceae bacterium]|nr:hypothetical protein [Saprospiraceae bacterium]
MKVAILEIAPHGHYTYVESMAMIYTSVPENEVVIFTNDKGFEALKHLVNDKISLEKPVNTEGVETLFQKIKGFDKVLVVTLEAYAKEPFRLMQVFEKTDFGCPIYYVIHNVDFWFQQSLTDKMRNVFYKLNGFKDFIYRLKVYGKYTRINQKIIEKIKHSNGKFVTLTSSVGNELAKYVGANRVAVIPFSIFDGRILAKEQPKTTARLRICLPGYVSSVRRDYASIFELLAQDKEGFLKQHVEWDFLGGISPHEGGEAIKQQAIDWQSKGYAIRVYDKPSVGLQEFDENLAQADIVLGNMHLQQGANSTYGKSKETGLIFTMIKAAKVGILPAEYACDAALSSSVLTFSTYTNLPAIFKKLIDDSDYWAMLKAEAQKNSEKFRPLSIYQRLEGKVVDG